MRVRERQEQDHQTSMRKNNFQFEIYIEIRITTKGKKNFQ